MEGRQVKKPGTAGRATAAFALLNLPLVATAVFVFWLGGGNAAEWWLKGIMGVLVAVAEFSIVVTTIAPPLYEWIKGEEWVSEGERPSWEKN